MPSFRRRNHQLRKRKQAGKHRDHGVNGNLLCVELYICKNIGSSCFLYLFTDLILAVKYWREGGSSKILGFRQPARLTMIRDIITYTNSFTYDIVIEIYRCPTFSNCVLVLVVILDPPIAEIFINLFRCSFSPELFSLFNSRLSSSDAYTKFDEEILGIQELKTVS
jgi:hypothetical protein